jgi:3-phosphoshikimate 1-carboxyvinyltransferase
MAILLRGDAPLHGTVRPTSDKSVSHRALILGAMAEGTTRIDDLNPGQDVRSTMECLRALGVRFEMDGSAVLVTGRAGSLRCPSGVLDCGNSGTTMRLLAGVLASQDFTATLDGDDSLRRRPMRRVAVPLRGLGARVEGPDNAEHAPLIVTGPTRRGGSFSSPVASAQIKSAALLAGAFGGQRVRIEEPGASRDHTERMLNAFGMECRHGDGFALVDPDPDQVLQAIDLRVPADPSAAALLAACAAAVPGSAIDLTDVMLNPRRTGFLDVMRRLGVRLDTEITSTQAGEDTGILRVESAVDLGCTTVESREIPGLVDEVPALAALAAFATGQSTFEGVAELRLKESDRLAEMVDLLGAFGIQAKASESTLEVTGGQPRQERDLPPTRDHRILMAAAILGLGARARGQARELRLDPAVAAVSDPSFFDHLQEFTGAVRD